tara:strand:+ start:416 stop:595 length:180 start_codon:yes stop_codon:yes gene_type:complete
MKYLFILDFEDGKVYRYNIMHIEERTNRSIFVEDFIVEQGHSLSNCEWMTTNNPEVITD